MDTPNGVDRLPDGPVRRMFSATQRRDLDAMLAEFADDYVNITPNHPARSFTGSAQVRKNWSALFAGIPDMTVTVLDSATGPGGNDPVDLLQRLAGGAIDRAWRVEDDDGGPGVAPADQERVGVHDCPSVECDQTADADGEGYRQRQGTADSRPEIAPSLTDHLMRMHRRRPQPGRRRGPAPGYTHRAPAGRGWRSGRAPPG